MKIGHLATIHENRAVYEVFRECHTEFKIEKYDRHQILVNTYTLAIWDRRVHCDKTACMAAMVSKQCHHVRMVNDAVRLAEREARWEQEKGLDFFMALLEGRMKRRE